MDKVVDYINIQRDRYVEELKALLAIPSISALPQHAADVRRCAAWMADEMGRVGLEHVRVIDTPGHPVVYGERLQAPGAPTILFYGHYDVQPVDPVEQWTSPPFEATVRDGEIYARGSADDKGQVFMHLKAVEAHIKQNGRLPVNLKFLLEGEEEVGSANLDGFIRANHAQLASDVVVISDSPMFERGVPSICYGLRGLVYYQVDLRGTKTDLHSGSFGGAVANPAFVLSQLLAQMKDRAGRIKIPGFYDDVRALTEEERAEWRRLPFNETRYRKELGAPRLFGEKGYTTLERVWARPTFEVNGLLSGFTGEGSKTVLPAVAMAKVSMRLVPDQRPDKIADLFEAYAKKDGAEDGRAEADAHARRQAVDGGLRQSLRAGGRSRDRARVRQAPGLQSRRWLHSRRVHVSRAAGHPVGALRRGASRRKCPRTEREARSRQLSQRHHRLGVSLRRNRRRARAGLRRPARLKGDSSPLSRAVRARSVHLSNAPAQVLHVLPELPAFFVVGRES